MDTDDVQQQTKPNLQTRLDEAFGNLGKNQGAVWVLKDHAASFKPGRDANLDSSDSDSDADDKDAAVAVAQGDSEVEAEELQEQDPHASRAFCKAFDREAEEDEFDVMATSDMRMHQEQESRPSRQLEVLDDNPFDRLCQLRQQQAAAERASTSHHQLLADPEAPSETTEDQNPGPRPQARIKPGHQAWAPPHQRQANSSCSDPPSEQPPGPPSAGQGPWGAGPSSHPRRAEQGWQPGPGARGRGSRGGRHQKSVPDHIKHPHKWTCYTLDEPLIVGGGEGGVLGSAGEAQELRSAVANAQAALSAAQPQEQEPEAADRYITEFGVGIQFRPKGARGKDKPQEGDKPTHTEPGGRLVSSWQDPDEQGGAGGGAMEVDAPAGDKLEAAAGGSADRQAATGKKRARQFRNRQVDDAS